jgi:protein TonB
MAVVQPTTPAPQGTGQRVRSFLGWAFVLSILIHAVTLLFINPNHQEAKKEEAEKVSVSKKVTVKPPTPPPPTPTPPPPTPPPKQTPPPVKQTNPPPQPKLKINPPKTTSKSDKSSSEQKYVAPAVGNENGNPNGTANSAPPAPPATGIPATPAPTPAPPTPTPKPQCANPNMSATTTNAVEPDYPEMAKEQGAEGSTQVQVSLDASGNILSATVYKSAGNALLDQAAIAAAKASKYTPEIVNCVKTAGTYIFRADFTGQ